jgi:hypothetical protein
MKRDNAIFNDLEQHFNDRLHQLMQDTCQRCEEASIPANMVMSGMSSVMMYEILKILIYGGYDRKFFLSCCGQAWDLSHDTIRRSME